MSSLRETVPSQQAVAPLFVGVDLGGTNIKLGIVDDQGRTVTYRHIATQVEQGPEAAARRIGHAVDAMTREIGRSHHDLARVGLATPGPIDRTAGMLLQPYNLPGWFNFPIRDRVAYHTRLPVTFANDASAACFGEYWRGSGKSYGSMILLTLGTGVGGGIILDGVSIDGRHGCGSECGHIVIVSCPTARRCPCGQTGHLEAYTSAAAVVNRTCEALDAGRASSLVGRRGAGEPITALMVAEEAEAGDLLATEIIMDTARYLGIGIVTLAHTIDPDGVVLGGAMNFGGAQSELGRRFLARVQQEFQSRCLSMLAEIIEIGFASLGSDAGYLGAAGLARQENGDASGSRAR